MFYSCDFNLTGLSPVIFGRVEGRQVKGCVQGTGKAKITNFPINNIAIKFGYCC